MDLELKVRRTESARIPLRLVNDGDVCVRVRREKLEQVFQRTAQGVLCGLGNIQFFNGLKIRRKEVAHFYSSSITNGTLAGL